MDFGILAKPDLPRAVATSRLVLDHLRKSGKAERVVLEDSLARAIGEKGVPLSKMKVDILVSVGGDGTVLRALQQARGDVFAINAGVLGFLTEVPLEEAISGLDRVLEGDYVVERRLRLRTDLRGKRLYDSTNEAVVHTSTPSKMRHYQIFLSGQLVDDVRADGIIVATPTGSTCYAMSAGGPILDPSVNAFVIVPLAPFKLSARAVVVPSDKRISISLMDDKPSKLVLDGQHEETVGHGDKLGFTASDRPARFIRFNPDFYAHVRRKLMVDPITRR